AEDGIRDRNVTGVQTCALPICPAMVRPDGWSPRATPRGWHQTESGLEAASALTLWNYSGGKYQPERMGGTHVRRKVVLRHQDRRSEERRVGRECRSGGEQRQSQ